MRRRKVIGVMGSAENPYEELSAVVGEVVAAEGYHLLTGAGEGVMREVAKTYTQTTRLGLSIGIVRAKADKNTKQMVIPWAPNKINEYIELAINTHLTKSDETANSRNHINALTADGLIFLPGGGGTHSELNLAIKYARPIAIFIGCETIASMTSEKLTENHPSLVAVKNREEICQFLRNRVGPSCA